MKQTTTLFLVLACGLSNVHAQTSPKIDWNLNKVLWSQTHHDPTKPGKPVMNFDIADNWQGLGEDLTISPNGKYIAYDTYKDLPSHWSKTDKIVLQATDNSWKKVLPPAKKDFGFFSSDSKQFIFQDNEGMCFLKLGSEERTYVKDFAEFKVPSSMSGFNNKPASWIAFSYKNKDLVLQNIINGEEKRYNEVASYDFLATTDRWFKCQTASELIFVDLKTGKEHRFDAPKAYALSDDASYALFSQDNSLEYVNLNNDSKTTVWTASNSSDTVDTPSFDSTGKKVIFNVKQAKGNSIWTWTVGAPQAKMVASQSSINPQAGFSLQSGAKFSENGKYINFSLQKPAQKLEVPKGAVELTLWSSRDQLLQSTQMKEKDAAATRNGILRIQDGKVVNIARQGEAVSLFGDCLVIVKSYGGYSNKATDRFWDKDYNRKTVSIRNLRTGAKKYLGAFNTRGEVKIAASPKSNYGVYYDRDKDRYCAINLNTCKIINVSKGLAPGFFRGRDYQAPGVQKSDYVSDPIGWLEDESGYLVYDDFDIWRLSPTGKAPANITKGYGRKNNICLKAEGYGWGGASVVNEKKMLLNGINVANKQNGLFSLTLGSNKAPEKLIYGPCFIRVTSWVGDFYNSTHDNGHPPLKAQNANIWIVKKDTPETGSNYYVTRDLKSYKALTSITPHKHVNWYTRKLHHYKYLDGTMGDGILYTPENFNPKKKYPVLIPFYATFASHVYTFQDPSLARSPAAYCTSPGWLVSHGYLVFVPDTKVAPLVYGPTNFNVIEGAAKYLNTLPFVAKGQIGAMSHSWSSKLGAYQLTHSKLVKAMWINEGYTYGNLLNTAFAPTTDGHESDMETVENGFEYGEFWKNKKTWLDQTTVLNVDKAQMPVILSCGNGDLKKDTYPSQSFELFNTLRRLNKSVWWFRYKNGGHNFMGNEQKDLTIRTMQFFDHYLKGAPAPKWMTQGIPNKLVGVETRLELDPKGSCGDKTCKVCKKLHSK